MKLSSKPSEVRNRTSADMRKGETDAPHATETELFQKIINHILKYYIMKDLFKKVHDFADEVIKEGREEGVAVIIAAIDTTVGPEEGVSNTVSAISGKGIDLIPLLGGLIDNKDLKPLITHAMLANILLRGEKRKSEKEENTPSNFN